MKTTTRPLTMVDDAAAPTPPAACGCLIRDYQHPNHHAAYHLHWSFGNGKLKKDHIVSFGLPAFRAADGFHTCPQAGTCALVCYARQGRYRTALVSRPREHNLAFLRTHSMDAFVKAATHDLRRLHPSWTRVRIHDSGDMCDEAYLLAWIAIANAFPHLDFYGYTKMIRLLQEHRLAMPTNLRLVQSVGGREDRFIDMALPHSRIFATLAACEAAGYVDGTHSDAPAYSGVVRIGLVYHGQTRLTPAIATRLAPRTKGDKK